MSDVWDKYLQYCQGELTDCVTELCKVEFGGQIIQYIKINSSKSSIPYDAKQNLLLFLDMFQDVYDWMGVLKTLCNNNCINVMWIFQFSTVLPFILKKEHISLFAFLDKKVFHNLEMTGDLPYNVLAQGYCATELCRIDDGLNFNKILLYEPYGITKLPYFMRMPFLEFIPFVGKLIYQAKLYALELNNLLFSLFTCLFLVILSYFSGFFCVTLSNVAKNFSKDSFINYLFTFVIRKVDHLHFVGASLWTIREYVSERYMFMFWRKNNMKLQPYSNPSTFIILGNESPNNYYDAFLLVGAHNVHVIENYKGLYPLFEPQSIANILYELSDCIKK